MGLIFQPEPVAKLKKRYAQAFEKAYDVNKIGAGNMDRPGLHRENVFDFKDGLRLIISKDQHNGDLYLHASASLREPFKDMSMIPQIIKRWLQLAGGKLNGEARSSMSQGGVIHIIIPFNQIKPLTQSHPFLN
jgi:hypothetical protein